MDGLHCPFILHREGSKLKMPNRVAGLTGGPEPQMVVEVKRSSCSDLSESPASPACSQITDEEHAEFLLSLRSVMTAFVDLGFGIHAAQQAVTRVRQDECPRLAEDFLLGTAQLDKPIGRT